MVGIMMREGHLKTFLPCITKPDSCRLYTECPLLDAKYAKETPAYFDEFYKTINDPAAAKREFTYPCDKNGTGNVIIKGLKND